MLMNGIKVRLLDFALQTIFYALMSWHQELNLKSIEK